MELERLLKNYLSYKGYKTPIKIIEYFHNQKKDTIEVKFIDDNLTYPIEEMIDLEYLEEYKNQTVRADYDYQMVCREPMTATEEKLERDVMFGQRSDEEIIKKWAERKDKELAKQFLAKKGLNVDRVEGVRYFNNLEMFEITFCKGADKRTCSFPEQEVEMSLKDLMNPEDIPTRPPGIITEKKTLEELELEMNNNHSADAMAYMLRNQFGLPAENKNKEEKEVNYNLYEVILVEKREPGTEPDILIDKKVVAKNREHAKGKAGVNEYLEPADYDTTKFVITTNELFYIREVEDGE